MEFFVQFSQPLRAPPELRARAHEVLLDIAHSLANVPPTSGLWSAMETGNAELNLGGWHFEYQVDYAARRIVVVGARKIGRSSTG
jgi:hypothetical protein